MTDVRKRAWDMAAEAEADGDVEVLSVEEAHDEWAEGGETVFLDVRDVRERWLEGAVPDDAHAPRGMLEFWADPETKYHRDYFRTDTRYVCYCNEGGRSALAAKVLSEMGFEDVGHIQGGFSAWQESGFEVQDVEQKDYS